MNSDSFSLAAQHLIYSTKVTLYALVDGLQYERYYGEDLSVQQPAAMPLFDNSAINQAGRHQAVAAVNKPLKIVWIFMQPMSCYYFSKIFIRFKDIVVRWEP